MGGDEPGRGGDGGGRPRELPVACLGRRRELMVHERVRSGGPGGRRGDRPRVDPRLGSAVGQHERGRRRLAREGRGRPHRQHQSLRRERRSRVRRERVHVRQRLGEERLGGGQVVRVVGVDVGASCRECCCDRLDPARQEHDPAS